MNNTLGLYVHIPFCLKKCAYCDFCSFPDADGEIIRRYSEEIRRRIKEKAPLAKERAVDTIYLGGGTPSLLPPREIDRIMNTILQEFSVAEDAEITLECNPGTVDRAKLKDIHASGVNRLSIGLQSAVDTELELLGRVHTRADFTTCFEEARAVGFDNVSADLMYGIPDQTLKTFEYSLRFLTELEPEHISAYGLSIEEGTPFHRYRSSLRIADDDTQAQMYELCVSFLKERGYKKYEISNFSKDKKESRHNLRYWRGLEYLGFGVAAHSYFHSQRAGNSRNLNAFLQGLDITEEVETLDEKAKRMEYVMLGLRLTEGIDVHEYYSRFSSSFSEDYPISEQWIKSGFMKCENSKVSFTEKGFLLSNSLLSEMLDFT